MQKVSTDVIVKTPPFHASLNYSTWFLEAYGFIKGIFENRLFNHLKVKHEWDFLIKGSGNLILI